MKRRRLITLLGGAAAATAFEVRGQQKAMPVIGFLHFGSPEPFAYLNAAFLQGLRELGWIEGQNAALEYRWAEGHYDRFPAMATELVNRKVDLIAAFGPPAVRAAKNATSTIPIVFGTGDAVAEGLVTSLAHPGGNLTGLSLLVGSLNPKRFELLSELVPQARVIAMLVNPNNAVTKTRIEIVREAANAKGIEVPILEASTENEIDAAFTTLTKRHADALLIGNDPFFMSRSSQFATLAARYEIPAIHDWREFVAAGGLISFGTSLTVTTRQIGIYAGRILRGEKPGDLPVEQPSTYELVINLKTARALGLTVPRSILERADEVIE
jgi:putative tryptophan/tyrosine transport system substrate-binding protein